MNIFDLKLLIARGTLAKCPMTTDDCMFLEFEQESIRDKMPDYKYPIERDVYITYLVTQEYTSSRPDNFKMVHTFRGFNCFETIEDLSLIKWEAKDYDGILPVGPANVSPKFQMDLVYKNDRYKLSSVYFQ